MRNRSRRSLATAGVVGVASMLLVACSSTAPASSPTGSQAPPSGALSFVASTTTQKAFESAIASFEKQYPDVTVNAQFLPIDQLQTQISTQLSSGSGPDVFISNPGTGILGVQRLAQAGAIQPIADTGWLQNVPEASRADITSDGQLYGAPTSGVFYFVTYNSQAYADLGLKPPTTFDELLGICTAARAAGKVAFAIPGAAANLLALTTTQLAVSQVYSSEPDWNAKKASGSTSFASSDGWKATIDEFTQMSKAGCFVDGAASSTFPDAVSQYASGSALSMITFSTQVGQLTAAAPTITNAVYPVPGATADQTRVPFATSITLAINANAQNPSAARAFIDFLTQPDQARAYAAAGGDVALVDVAANKLPAYMDGISTLVQNGNLVAIPIFVWPSAAYSELGVRTQGILTGATDEAQILAALDSAWG